MPRPPKPVDKRKDYVLRARVNATIKARTVRVCERRTKDESEWVREGLIAYLDAEEARLGLKPITPEEVSALLGDPAELVSRLNDAAEKFSSDREAAKKKQAARKDAA